jgi:hypothetical protein
MHTRLEARRGNIVGGILLALLAGGASVGSVGCRCDTPPSVPDVGVPAPPPPPPEVRDAGADVPDASDGPPVRHTKRPAPAPAPSGGGGFKVEGTLAKADAEKVVRAGYSKLRACSPGAKGKATFRLTVDPRGRVTLGEVVHSTLAGDDTEMCMIRTTRDLKFPASGGESKIDFGMTFGK